MGVMVGGMVAALVGWAASTDARAVLAQAVKVKDKATVKIAIINFETFIKQNTLKSTTLE